VTSLAILFFITTLDFHDAFGRSSASSIISSFENLLLDKKIIIKVFDCDKNTVAEMEADYLLAKIYIKIPPINFPSHIRIYVKDKDGNLKEIAVSNEVILSYEREIRKEYNYLK